MLGKKLTTPVVNETTTPKSTRSKLVDVTRQEDVLTANGALTNSTSLNNVVDMFFLAGASRTMTEDSILKVWTKAVTEDKELAFKCLFRARDIRGGAGERRFFRTIWNSLDKQEIKHYEQFVSEYGRRDDLHLTSLDFIVEQFRYPNPETFQLLCKWTPRKGIVFEYIRKALGISPKEMRGILVENTNVVEQLMSFRQWTDIEYKKVPSQAFQKYKKAFYRNDQARFEAFFTETPDEIKSGTLFPYQLYQSFKKGERNDVIDAQWNNLPNYVGEGKSFLPVCDVSGSMGGLPLDISVSLGVYLSERNKSVFKDAFITFSGNPVMEYLKGTVCQRFKQLENAHRDTNTNLLKVFHLILNSAVQNNLSQNDLPEAILIISDMEFDDACSGYTNYQVILDAFIKYGYKVPNIVFWNVNGREKNVPVKYDTRGTALVSGASPAIIKSLLGGDDMTPIGIMLKTLNSERYLQIK